MMITKSAKYISEVLVHEKIVEEKERPIYQYGLELLISTVINLLLVIILGICLGSPVQGILYFLVLATLRTKAGGYHAPSYFMCGMLYSVMFIITVRLAELLYYVKVNEATTALVLFINTCFFGAFAPVLHKRKADRKERKQAKIKAVGWSLVWNIIALCLYHMNSYWTHIIVISITSISVFMIVGKIMERKEEEYEKGN